MLNERRRTSAPTEQASSIRGEAKQGEGLEEDTSFAEDEDVHMARQIRQLSRGLAGEEVEPYRGGRAGRMHE